MRNVKLIGALNAAIMASMLLSGAARSDDDGDRNNRGDHPDQSERSRIRVGYEISPVALNLRGKNRAMVGLGSYIVNAQGACNDCHTHPSFAPGGDPYLGQPEVVNSEQYMTGGRQFGPFTSRNLTPDQYGRPAGLTFEEFLVVMRTGAEPDRPAGSHLPPILQVMPWPAYGKMTEHDLRAIYEYLRAIPSRPDNPAPGP